MSALLHRRVEEGGVILAAVLLLGSCATSHGPSLSDAVAWNFTYDDNEAKLAWGRPNSDDVGLMLTCKPHSGQVLLTSDGAPGERRLELVSDNIRSELTTRVEPDAMSDGALIEASAPLSDGALSAFARSGRLTLIRKGQPYSMTATDGDRRAVRQFFRACA